MRDVARDFIRLSQAMSAYQNQLPHELVCILEHCLEDSSYEQIARANLIASLTTDMRIRIGLETIVNDKSDDFTRIQTYVRKLLEQVKNNPENGEKNPFGSSFFIR